VYDGYQFCKMGGEDSSLFSLAALQIDTLECPDSVCYAS